jgi:hypothetical protein
LLAAWFLARWLAAHGSLGHLALARAARGCHHRDGASRGCVCVQTPVCISLAAHSRVRHSDGVFSGGGCLTWVLARCVCSARERAAHDTPTNYSVGLARLVA